MTRHDRRSPVRPGPLLQPVPGAAMLVALAALPSAAAAAAPRDDAAARRAYYAVRYPGEQGPFARRQEAIDAALRALHAQAEAEEWWTEWLTLVTRDRYGKWWHSAPKEGEVLPARQCLVGYSIREIRRPGSTLVSTAHSHPHGDLFPDPRPSAPDNGNAHEMFLLRGDGQIWFFRPHDTHSKLYGRARSDGAIESRYTGHDEALLRSRHDAGAVVPGPPPLLPQPPSPPTASAERDPRP